MIKSVFVKCLFLVLFITSLTSAFTYEKDTNPKILILNSYHPGNIFSDQEIAGLKSIMPVGTEFHIEYFEGKSISGNTEYEMYLLEIFKIKYSKIKIDLIVSMDDDAFQFLLKYHGSVFFGIPVVFCGVNKFYDSLLEDKKDFTGVVETIDIKATVDVAIKFHPDIKTIYFINDNTTSGKINTLNFQRIIKSNDYNIDFIFLTPESGLTFEELLLKIDKIKDGSLINFLNFYQDKTGAVFEPETIIPIIIKRAVVPVYTQSGDLLGSGLVGGKVNSGFFQGEAAGKIALRILAGEKPSEIKVIKEGTTKYLFDYKQIKKWKIPLNKLPEGSMFINKPYSFFKKYFILTLSVMIFVFIETMLIAVLMLNILMRKSAEKKLKEKTAEAQRGFNYSLDLLSILDMEGNYISLNPEWEKVFGYKVESLKGINCLELLHPDDVGNTSNIMRKIVEQKIDFEYINRFRCKDGSYRHIEWRSYLSDEFIYSSGRDITEKFLNEKSLIKSEKRFKALYLNMAEGVAVHETVYDDDGKPVNYKIVEINPQYEKITGFKEKEIINRLATDLYGTETPPYFEEYVKVSETGVPYHFETYFLPMEKHFAISAVSIQKGLWATIFFDITEQKKSEEERNRLFNLSIDMLSIASFNGHLKQVNPAWTKTLGWSENELLSNPWLYFVHPDDKEATISTGEKLMAGESVLGFRNRYLHKDGSYRWLSWNSFPFSETKEIFGVVRDITEQKKNEEQLLKINRLYRVLSNINQCIVKNKDVNKVFYESAEILVNDGCFAAVWIGIFDESASIKIVSDCNLPSASVKELQKELLLKDKNELISYRVLEKNKYIVVNFPGKQNFYEKEFFKKISGREYGSFGVFPFYKDDKIAGIINIYSYENNYFDENEITLLQELAGDISYFLFVFDQEERRKTAESEIKKLNSELAERVYQRTRELEDANKELESFSYSVSHDLRAPLRHINGFVEILMEEAGVYLKDENKRQLSVISESAKKMGDLIDSLLEFSRMNKSELHFAQIDTNLLVNKIVMDFQDETENRNIKWSIKELPATSGDELLLRLVWENLISNAVKYTKNSKYPEIEIGCIEKNKKEINFYIKDNGVGFDMQFVGKLFGVFQRLHKHDDFPGIGIGLANVKRIILRHGGRVWAEGKINEGSTFYFSLPAQENKIE